MRSAAGSVQKLGSNYYKVTATVGFDSKTGKQKRRSKRVHGSRRDAQLVLASFLQDGGAIDPSSSLATVTTSYLEHQKGRIKHSTWLDYQKLCKPIYNCPFADCPIGDIPKHERDIRRWLDTFEKEWTRRAEYKMLRQVLNYAKRHHMLRDSPLDFIDPPKPKRKEITTISTSEFKKYLQAVRGLDIEPGILSMLYMGLRRSEACARKWSDIDFDTATMKIDTSCRLLPGGGIEIGSTKTEKSTRIVVIPAPCLVRLREIKKINTDEWMCESEGHAMRPDVFSKKWRSALTKADLERIQVKNLRHSCGTMLIREMGASIADVAELLGHSTTRITESFYLQQSTESKKRVAKLWDKME